MRSGGGTEVGHIVATGMPQPIAESENSVTGRFLI